jgi:hypothetical protein
MTCEETRKGLGRDPASCTNAEVGAISAHVIGCTECSEWLAGQQQIAEEEVGKEAAEEARALGRLVSARCSRDPEVMAMVRQAVVRRIAGQEHHYDL